MQKAILESRLRFTALLKVIADEWEDINDSRGRPGGRVDLDALSDTDWMKFFR